MKVVLPLEISMLKKLIGLVIAVIMFFSLVTLAGCNNDCELSGDTIETLKDNIRQDYFNEFLTHPNAVIDDVIIEYFFGIFNDRANPTRQANINRFNGVFIASAGNSTNNLDTDPQFPAAYNNVIPVGAIRYGGTRNPSSNFGSTVDIFAPTNVQTAALNNGVRTYGGTSAAAPHVTGVAALIYSVNPTLTRDQVRAILMNNADTVQINAPGLGNHNVRMLNAHRSVASAGFVTSNIGTNDISVNGLRVVNNMPENATLNIPNRIAPWNAALAAIGTNVQRNVTNIGANAFSGNTRVMNVSIPSTVGRVNIDLINGMMIPTVKEAE